MEEQETATNDESTKMLEESDIPPTIDWRVKVINYHNHHFLTAFILGSSDFSQVSRRLWIMLGILHGWWCRRTKRDCYQ